MWRVVNFRCFLFTALCCITTTLICVFFPYSWAIFATIVLLTALFLCGILYLLSKNLVKAISLILCCVCVLVVATNVLIDKNSTASELETNKEYAFTASVTTVSKSENTVTLILDKVKADIDKIDGKISLRVHKVNNALLSVVKIGDVVSFSASADFNSVYDNANINAYAYKNDIKYYAEIDENLLSLTGYKPTFFQKIKNEMLSALENNLDGYGALAYGMITGETGEIVSAVRSYYSASGLGHILAVSGLHVGFITLILSFICRKANRWLKLVVTTLSLLFYCFLAGFSASVVRASIMCIVGLLALTLGKRNDTLSSLSLAMTVILLIKPLLVFDAGFLMSVSAVLGIVLFSKNFSRVFSKFLPNKIAKALSVSISAQVGITPVMIAYFGTIPTYSIITNLLFMPLITVTFICIVISLILTLIFSKLGALLSISGIGLSIIDTIAQVVSKLPLAQIRVFSFVGIMGVLAVYFLCSKFFMLPKLKWLFTTVICVATTVVVIIFNVPLKEKYDVITTAAYKDVTVLLRASDEVALVGDCKDYDAMESMLATVRERKVDKVYLTKCTADTANSLVELATRYKIKAVYCPDSVDYSGFNKLVENKIPFYLFSKVEEASIVKPVFIGDQVAYQYSENSISLLIAGYGFDFDELSVDIVNSCALIRSYVFSGDYDKRAYLVNYGNSYLDQKPDREVVLKNKTIALDLKSGKSLMV